MTENLPEFGMQLLYDDELEYSSRLYPPTPNPLKQAIDKLITTIQNLDDDDNVPQSVKTSLTAALKQISNILDDNNNPNNNDQSALCGKLGAFINQVNDATERRGTLTSDQADDLRTQAEDIRNTVGC